jgi:hypothetical protein
MIRAAATMSLSAIGSRNLPNNVTISIRLAMYPSSQSVMEAKANNRVAKKPAVREGESNRITRSGIMAILNIVKKFGILRIVFFAN